jgi:hypothetical protein
MQDLGSSVAMRMRRLFPYTTSEASIPDAPAPRPRNAPMPVHPPPNYAKACTGMNLIGILLTTKTVQNELVYLKILLQIDRLSVSHLDWMQVNAS